MYLGLSGFINIDQHVKYEALALIFPGYSGSSGTLKYLNNSQ